MAEEVVFHGVRKLSLIKLVNEFSNARRQLREDREQLKKLDPSFEKAYQFLFHAGYRSLRLYRHAHAFYNAGFKFFAYFIYHLNRIMYSVDIHPACEIEAGVVIDHGTGIVIGSTARVGRGTIIYHGVTLGTRYIVSGKRHPTVGRNVVLGAGAKILGPITIGDFAKIGANSVVLEDVPANSTVIGIPGRVVKKDEKDESGIHGSFSNDVDNDFVYSEYSKCSD